MKTLKMCIAATALTVVLAIWFFTPTAVGSSDGQVVVKPGVQVVGPPSVAETPSGLQMLFFAPTQGRNLAMDEKIVELRHNGTNVTYVTGADQFLSLLYENDWNSVLVADVSEEVLAPEILAEYAEQDCIVVRANSTSGTSAETADAVFYIRMHSSDGLPRDGSTIFPATSVGIDWGAIIEWMEARAWCMAHTTMGSAARRACDAYANCCLSGAESGNPCSPNGSADHTCGVAPWAPKVDDGSDDTHLPAS